MSPIVASLKRRTSRPLRSWQRNTWWSRLCRWVERRCSSSLIAHGRHADHPHSTPTCLLPAVDLRCCHHRNHSGEHGMGPGSGGSSRPRPAAWRGHPPPAACRAQPFPLPSHPAGLPCGTGGMSADQPILPGNEGVPAAGPPAPAQPFPCMLASVPRSRCTCVPSEHAATRLPLDCCRRWAAFLSQSWCESSLRWRKSMAAATSRHTPAP